MLKMQKYTEIDPQSYTILVIDDNPTNLKVMVDYLSNIGFRILIARSGESGIQRARFGQPNLILLDILMPGIDGFETCQHLKADELTRDIPVIFMTALVETKHKIQGFNVGGVDYVTKPIQHDELLARITAHLRIRDLTSKLQEANAVLSRTLSDRDKFFSIVAHDLKGPFHPVIGLSEILIDTAETATPDQILKFSTDINESAKQVYNLLDNLLQWAKMQMNRIQCNPESVNLRSNVEQSIRLLKTNAIRKRIILQQDIAESIFVYADPYMLSTIIRNLASNALKFTLAGGQVTISAQVTTEQGPSSEPPPDRHSGYVQISVSDTGIGMRVEDIEKLFKTDAHYSTPGTENERGTGVGLMICQEMAQNNGGEIWVESTPGQGSTFFVALPHGNAPEDCLEPQSSPYYLEIGKIASSPTTAEAELEERQPLRILLAEDIVVNQKVTLKLLSKLGYQADVVTNGLKVLAALEKQTYDVILMDIQMPEMDGMQAAQKIRKMLPEEQQPYILALTASNLSEELQVYREAGINDCLSKPIRMGDLRYRLSQCEPLNSPESGP